MKRYRHYRWVFLLAFAVVIALSACSSDDETTSTEAASETPTTEATSGTETPDDGSGSSSGETPSGGFEALEMITWAGAGPVVTLDGSVAGDAASMNGILLTSGQMTRFDADRQPYLDLAESVELSDDGLTAVVTLLPGLVYSDGTPVLAEDFAFAYERNLDGTGAGVLQSMAGIEATDDRTAVVTLKGPDPDFLSWLAERSLQLHPKSLIESDPDYWSHPVSAGPYMVEEGWTPGDPIFSAVENPNYVNGPMAVKKIRIIAVADSSSRILQLQTGDIDAAVDLPLTSLDVFPEEVVVGFAGVGGTNYVIANQTLGGPLADERVRQAISLAIDREAVSQLAFLGAQPASTSPMYDCGPLCERNLLPGAGARDLDAAKALLAEAGFADGFAADMKVSSSRGGWQEAAVIVSQNLADIGIDVQITPVDEGQHYSSIAEQNYEMFFTGGGGHHQLTLSQMLSPTDFWVKATGWTPPDEAAAVLAETASALDLAVRTAAYTEAQAIWSKAAHVIAVVERVQVNGSRIPEYIFVPQIANDQKVLIYTLAEAQAAAGG